jgi:hypothetical protein
MRPGIENNKNLTSFQLSHHHGNIFRKAPLCIPCAGAMAASAIPVRRFAATRPN